MIYRMAAIALMMLSVADVAAARNSENDMEAWLRACAEAGTVGDLKECVTKLITLRHAHDQAGKLTKVFASGCAKETTEKMRACLEIIAGQATASRLDGPTSEDNSSVWKLACGLDTKTNERSCTVKASVGKKGEVSVVYAVPSEIIAVTATARGTVLMAARMQIDGQPPVLLELCQNGICFPGLGPDPELVARMRAGSVLRVGYDSLLDRSPLVEIPLIGFGDAIERARRELRK